MNVKCFSVKPRKAEKVRLALIEAGALLRDFAVINEKDQVLFPVKEDIDVSILDGVGARIKVMDRDLVKKKTLPSSYKELLTLDADLMNILPSSFDLIGDIAIMRLPDELLPYRMEIGNALRMFNRNIRTTALDRGVMGEFRIRELEVLSGDGHLETTHVENNLRFKLDPSLVYFSPRLATERMRIAGMVGEERVLDMFAGVGPFSITIASLGKAVGVVGIDLNPDSIRYFNANIVLNSMEDRVEAHLGDARDISLVLGPFDRVIMNLPHHSMEFLDVALGSMEQGNIHLYRVLEQGQIMGEVGRMMTISEKEGKSIRITNMREVHNYSPNRSMVVFDISVLP
ncbi:MAG: class I SAM-dependent methyltransferase family protein [Candidatus Thermoplasmatota archaeon]|nr:class I SAM-dependent methyltransferase family protein [Candidatus Thermoplasmatota archaeon]